VSVREQIKLNLLFKLKLCLELPFFIVVAFVEKIPNPVQQFRYGHIFIQRGKSSLLCAQQRIFFSTAEQKM
jgi:hypothetical protein